MKELIAKSLALSWGVIAITRETAEKLVDELVKKGEVKQEEAKDWVSGLVERGKKAREEVQQTIRQEVTRALKELSLPSRDDLLRLEEKLDRLLEREEKKGTLGGQNQARD
ncbi:MAG TPA: polyhydroxyalkanoate synthesis regulator [Firmicutes bacterium]|jgi:polyhydroxyalkanoate synthesis regulator phasin|nr:polyhydroxyalkanoate synthesis regulator [Bacillota bacterium]